MEEEIIKMNLESFKNAAGISGKGAKETQNLINDAMKDKIKMVLGGKDLGEAINSLQRFRETGECESYDKFLLKILDAPPIENEDNL